MNPLIKIELYGGKRRKPRKSKKKKGTPPLIKIFKEELISHATKAEEEFRKALDHFGWHYEFQKVFKTAKGYKIADFYLKDYATVIEVDGEYHNDREQMQADAYREKLLLGNNQIKRIHRFTNSEILRWEKKEIHRQLVMIVCPESKEFLWGNLHL